MGTNYKTTKKPCAGAEGVFRAAKPSLRSPSLYTMASQLLPLLLAVLAQPFVEGLPHAVGSIKEFSLGVTLSQEAPVGIPKEMFLINGQSPGPVLEIEQDDWVVVRVQNDSPYNITIHFHGIEMHGTPWSDGVPGITQRPIRPSGSFVYEFQATQQGSYWYHAHYRGQIEDGLTGPIVIHPRKSNPKPFSLISSDPKTVLAMEAAERNVQPLLISDWTYMTSSSKDKITIESNLAMSCYDAILFNGKGRVECLAENDIQRYMSPIQRANLKLVPGASITDKGCLPPSVMGALGNTLLPVNHSAIPYGAFEGCTPTKGDIEVISPPVTSESTERWMAIDLIAATNFVRAAVSIDEHDMWVYAVDGSYVEPQKIQAAIFFSGDRFSVLVKTDKPGHFKIRVNAITAPQLLTGHAILSVGGTAKYDAPETKAYINIAGGPASPDVVFFNQSKAVPFPPRPIPRLADELHVLNMSEGTSTYLWALNSSRLMPEDFEDETPILLRPNPHAMNNVTITTRNGTWIDLVILAGKYPFPAHPIHKHGNKMYLIGSGTGPFRWASVEEAIKEKPQYFNLVNPPRRDTVTAPAAREDMVWIVVRYHVTNPGAWMLHCHIANHMTGGMSMVIQDGIDAWPEVPLEYQR